MSDATRTEVRELFVALTADEVMVKGESLAVKLQEIAATEEAAKENAKTAKQEITALKGDASELARIIRERRELRDVEVCIVQVDGSKVHEIRTDTGELLRERPMTEAERQLALPRIGDGAKVVGGE